MHSGSRGSPACAVEWVRLWVGWESESGNDVRISRTWHNNTLSSWSCYGYGCSVALLPLNSNQFVKPVRGLLEGRVPADSRHREIRSRRHWPLTCEGTFLGGSMRMVGSHSPGGKTVTWSKNSSIPDSRSTRSRALYATSWNICRSQDGDEHSTYDVIKRIRSDVQTSGKIPYLFYKADDWKFRPYTTHQ